MHLNKGRNIHCKITTNVTFYETLDIPTAWLKESCGISCIHLIPLNQTASHPNIKRFRCYRYRATAQWCGSFLWQWARVNAAQIGLGFNSDVSAREGT